MENKNLNSRLIVAFQMLGFEDISKLPKLEDVRKQFFDCARKTHPDKNSNTDSATKEKRKEKFKKLFNAYKLTTEFIIQNEDNQEDTEDYEDFDSDTEDQGDEEICFDEKEYREVNIVSTNSHSVTIKIPTIHADTWEQVLDQEYGTKIDRSVNNNGIQ